MPPTSPSSPPAEPWPDLTYESWADTRETLHRWSQIVGKTRMALEPMLNHWWQVPLYVSVRGLTTSAMPYGAAGSSGSSGSSGSPGSPGSDLAVGQREMVEVEFDFLAHQLEIRTSEGGRRSLALAPRSVADFYAEYRAALADLGVGVAIWPVPVELASDALPFAEDKVHGSYDPAAAHRFWRVLLQADRVLKAFRARFIGKASPVHFFWGSFDLAVTRFSGRPAPPHPGGAPHVADWVMREAYSHEVSSAGFWPGSPQAPVAAFYAYAYPTPAGFAAAPVAPAGATFLAELGEFVLPYDTLRAAADPDAALLAFLESTYAAAADLGGWDRAALERAGAGARPA